MAAAFAAGADGVRVGTRFVAAAEAGVHPEYVAALITAEAQDTAYTEAFSVGWSNAPHRVLRSSIAAAEAFQEGDAIGETSRLDGTRMPIVFLFELSSAEPTPRARARRKFDFRLSRSIER